MTMLTPRSNALGWNTIRLQIASVSTIETIDVQNCLTVYDTWIESLSKITWDITTDLETGSEASDTLYYAYLTEDGTPKLSVTAPEKKVLLNGYYHPTNTTWRCVGAVYNDSGSDFLIVRSYDTLGIENITEVHFVSDNDSLPGQTDYSASSSFQTVIINKVSNTSLIGLSTNTLKILPGSYEFDFPINMMMNASGSDNLYAKLRDTTNSLDKRFATFRAAIAYISCNAIVKGVLEVIDVTDFQVLVQGDYAFRVYGTTGTLKLIE